MVEIIIGVAGLLLAALPFLLRKTIPEMLEERRQKAQRNLAGPPKPPETPLAPTKLFEPGCPEWLQIEFPGGAMGYAMPKGPGEPTTTVSMTIHAVNTSTDKEARLRFFLSNTEDVTKRAGPLRVEMIAAATEKELSAMEIPAAPG